MNDRIAKLISYLFHPLVLPVYAVLLLFFLPSWISGYQYEYKKTISLIVFLLTLIIPTLILLILLNLRVIRNLTLYGRKDRYIPYAVIAFFYTSAYIVMVHFPLGIPANISNFVLIADIIIVVLMLLNFVFKISAHMAGIGGFFSFFYVFILKEVMSDILFSLFNIDFTILFFIIFLVILSGIIASARLQLNDHNVLQIVLGFLIGFFIGLFSFWI